MTEALFQSLRPVQKGDYELAFVEAQLVRNPDDEGNLLDLAQARIVGVGRPHHPDLFVGEVMLSQFKSILQREGFQVGGRARAGAAGAWERRSKILPSYGIAT